MNPETPTPREQLEARLTALLLGELPADEAAALREAIVKDGQLAALHGRLEQTIGLVRETAADPVEQTAEQPAPMRLSEERRQKLLAQFKTVAPKEFARPRRWNRDWLVPAAAVAAVVVLAAIIWPFNREHEKYEAKARNLGAAYIRTPAAAPLYTNGVLNRAESDSENRGGGVSNVFDVNVVGYVNLNVNSNKNALLENPVEQAVPVGGLGGSNQYYARTYGYKPGGTASSYATVNGNEPIRSTNGVITGGRGIDAYSGNQPLIDIASTPPVPSARNNIVLPSKTELADAGNGGPPNADFLFSEYANFDLDHTKGVPADSFSTGATRDDAGGQRYLAWNAYLGGVPAAEAGKDYVALTATNHLTGSPGAKEVVPVDTGLEVNGRVVELGGNAKGLHNEAQQGSVNFVNDGVLVNGGSAIAGAVTNLQFVTTDSATASTRTAVIGVPYNGPPRTGGDSRPWAINGTLNGFSDDNINTQPGNANAQISVPINGNWKANLAMGGGTTFNTTPKIVNTGTLDVNAKSADTLFENDGIVTNLGGAVGRGGVAVGGGLQFVTTEPATVINEDYNPTQRDFSNTHGSDGGTPVDWSKQFAKNGGSGGAGGGGGGFGGGRGGSTSELAKVPASEPGVNIRARFAEITRNDQQALGFQWDVGSFTAGNTVVASGGTQPSLNAPATPTVTGILAESQFRAALQSRDQRDGTHVLTEPGVTTESGRQGPEGTTHAAGQALPARTLNPVVVSPRQSVELAGEVPQKSQIVLPGNESRTDLGWGSFDGTTNKPVLMAAADQSARQAEEIPIGHAPKVHPATSQIGLSDGSVQQVSSGGFLKLAGKGQEANIMLFPGGEETPQTPQTVQPGQQAHVVALKNANPADVRQILKDSFPDAVNVGGVAAGSATETQSYSLLQRQQTVQQNTLTASSGPVAGAARPMFAGEYPPADSQRYYSKDYVVAMTNGFGILSSTRDYPNSTAMGPVSTSVDPETGALIVVADDKTWKSVSNVVAGVDYSPQSNVSAKRANNFGIAEPGLVKNDGQLLVEQEAVRREAVRREAARIAGTNQKDVNKLVSDGKVYFEAGKYDEAEARFKQALKQDPANLPASQFEGLILEKKDLNALAKNGPDSANAMLQVDQEWSVDQRSRLKSPGPVLSTRTNTMYASAGRDAAQLPPTNGKFQFGAGLKKPVGEGQTNPGPNLFSRTNMIYTGKGRQAIQDKLNRIQLEAANYPELPLAEVLDDLMKIAKNRDPDGKGINFSFNRAGQSNNQPVDISQVKVRVDMNNIRLADVLDAITKTADLPIKYSVLDYAVEFSLDTNAPTKAAPTAKVAQIEDRPAPRVAAPALVPQPEVLVRENAFSTFSLNVSDVSFKLAGVSLEKGLMPDPGSVRSEEFINAFDYRDPEPPPGAPVGFAWERARYPFAHNRDLLRFAIKTAAAGRQPGRSLNIVLLLDNSGSMERADRVAIIREALRVLASQLQPQDRLSVVTFARTPRLWVDGISGSEAAGALEKAGELTPEGGTNLEEAMRLAYETALRHYLANGMNRVVLLTDGAANLGNVDPAMLKREVELHRKQGVALDCFGIGWEGYNDDLLEVLSRNGDGRYGFINTPEEAATGFAGQLAGAFNVAASDVKVQVEFNPKRATVCRQIGYAKHQLTKEQFRDNTVNAAQIAAAESGNALYTVEVNPQGEGPVCTVRVRYRNAGTQDYREQAWDVPYEGGAVALEQASPAMRLAATAGAFSEWLGASPFAAEVTTDSLLGYLGGVPQVYGADARPAKLEAMIRQAKAISGK